MDESQTRECDHEDYKTFNNKYGTWRKCPECDIMFKLRREYDKHKAAYHSLLSDQQIVKFLNTEMESKNQQFQVNTFVVS